MSNDDLEHFAAILERVEDSMGVIAEGHTVLNAKLDKIGARLGRVEEDVAKIDFRLGRVEKRLEHVEDNVASIDGRVHRIEDRLGLNGVSKPKSPAKAASKRTSRRK